MSDPAPSPGEPAGPPRFPGNAPPPPPATAPGSPAWPATSGGGQEDAPPPYASWAIRLGGYLIDAVIFLVVLVALFLLFGHAHVLELHLLNRRAGHRRRTVSALPFVVAGLLWILYGTLLCGSRRGQTVGMMAVRVRAVRDGEPAELGYGRALGRAAFEGALRLLNLLFFLLGILWVLDMLFPLWDAKRQTLHDKVAGSVVLRVTGTG